MTPSPDSSSTEIPAVDQAQAAAAANGVRLAGWVDAGAGPRPPEHGDEAEDAGGAYFFDGALADRWQRFFEGALLHTKGEHARQRFVLLPWQRDRLVRPFFGWRRERDGTRRYRRQWLRIARKNGKSTLLSGVALGALLIDEEPSAEVYGCAADREQAGIVFREARAMRDLNPKMAEATIATKHAILFRDRDLVSTYRCLSADAATKHGLNPSAIIFDEVHAQPNADLYEVMTTATGARRQPIEAFATTAGHDTLSICYELDQVAAEVAAGAREVPDLLPLIFEVPPAADPFDPANWPLANPSLGHTVKAEYLAKMAAEARANPRAENSFRRLHCDQWTEQAVRWVPTAAWDACDGAAIDEARLVGRRAYGGLDLAATTDTAAWVILFEPGQGDPLWRVLFRCFLPDKDIAFRVERDRVPYQLWAQRGLVTLTPGPVTDYEAMERRIEADHARFNLRQIRFDRWNSTDLVRRLKEKGVPLEPMGQGYASMSEPMKALERLVLGGRIGHGRNPVARWQFGNVAAIEDENKNVKPAKRASRGRIDLIVALIEAVAAAGAPVEEKIPGIASLG